MDKQIEQGLTKEIVNFLKINYKNNHDNIQFERFDLYGVINFFIKNYKSLPFYSEDGFLIHEPKNRAGLVRTIRNKYAHIAVNQTISIEEQLFDLMMIRQFLLDLIDGEITNSQKNLLEMLNIKIEDCFNYKYNDIIKENDKKDANELIYEKIEQIINNQQKQTKTSKKDYQLEGIKEEIKLMVQKIDNINTKIENQKDQNEFINSNDDEEILRMLGIGKVEEESDDLDDLFIEDDFKERITELKSDSDYIEWFKDIGNLLNWGDVSKFAKKRNLLKPNDRKFLYNMGVHFYPGDIPSVKQIKYLKSLYDKIRDNYEAD